MADVKIDADKLQDERIVEAFGYVRRPITKNTSLMDVYKVARQLDMNTNWFRNGEYADAHIKRIEAIYSYIDEVAPNGFINNQTTRAQSVAEVRDVFSKYSKEEIENAVDFIERLGGDQTIGPKFRNSHHGNFQETKFRKDGGISQQIKLDGRSGSFTDRTTTLYHEVAHWAYEHILTPRDKLEFWRSMNKYYDPEMELDFERLKTGVSIYGRGRDRCSIADEIAEAEDGLGDGSLIVNSLDSLKFFAQQFEVWATRQRNIGNDSFWLKIPSTSRYYQQVCP